MILNIIGDEKFTPFLQGLFGEGAPGTSQFRVITKDPVPRFASVGPGTEVFDDTYFRSKKFGADLTQATCVIFHSLRLEYAFAALRVPKHVPIVWRGWGFDYYDILSSKGLDLILPMTNAALDRRKLTDRVFTRRSRRDLMVSIMNRVFGKSATNRFIARVDYFSCCVPDDYAALREALPHFKARFLPLNYYSIEDIFLCGENVRDLSGKNILLGNSASPTNNHFEAIELLSELGMNDRKVIVPLSYGDDSYRKKVLAFGQRLLGDSFLPLTTYMPLPEYNSIVSSCGNVIMNHVRQQAIGNVSAALLRGGKVFLRPENSIYKYYSRLGCQLFKFQEGLSLADLDSDLSAEDMAMNKALMTETWSRARGILNVAAIDAISARVS